MPVAMNPPDSAHLPQSDCCWHVYAESGGTSVHGVSGSTRERTYLLWSTMAVAPSVSVPDNPNTYPCPSL